MSDVLGAATLSQYSIEETVNIETLLKIFTSNLITFRDLVKNSDDIYAKELFEQLEENKEFNFPINKHMELFIIKNQKNIVKIIKYIIFRYKFYMAGKKK